MRTLLVIGWLMVPVGFAAYHYGPGQEQLQLDDTAALVAQAERAAAAEDWEEAVAGYDEALRSLPANRPTVARRLRLEKAKAQMMNRELPEAHQELKALTQELKDDPKADSRFVDEANTALAGAQYYMTWLMKLEGEPRDRWEPEIESSRQIYRLLAEQAEKTGDDKAATKLREDLESAVRLARMDPKELQGLSLPCQCQGCKSGKCKNPGRKPSTSKNQPKDVRGASSGAPPDDGGH
jgi:hypothetical protein